VTRPGPRTKLTREQALAIRESYQRFQVGTATLGARYGVSTSMISAIIRGTHSTAAGLPNIARQKLTAVADKYLVTRTFPGQRRSDTENAPGSTA
jgi:hypothetical protein